MVGDAKELYLAVELGVIVLADVFGHALDRARLVVWDVSLVL